MSEQIIRKRGKIKLIDHKFIYLLVRKLACIQRSLKSFFYSMSSDFVNVLDIDAAFAASGVVLPRSERLTQALLSGARFLVASRKEAVRMVLRELSVAHSVAPDLSAMQLGLEFTAILNQPGMTARKFLGLGCGGKGKRLNGWRSLIARLLNVKEEQVWALLGSTIVFGQDAEILPDLHEPLFSYLWAVFMLSAFLLESWDSESPGSRILPVPGYCLWQFKFDLRPDFTVVLDPWQSADFLILFTCNPGTDVPDEEIARGQQIYEYNLELAAAIQGALENPPYSAFLGRTEPPQISLLRALCALPVPQSRHVNLLRLYESDPQTFYEQISFKEFAKLAEQAASTPMNSPGPSTPGVTSTQTPSAELKRDFDTLLKLNAEYKQRLETLEKQANKKSSRPANTASASSRGKSHSLSASSLAHRSSSVGSSDSDDSDSDLSDRSFASTLSRDTMGTKITMTASTALEMVKTAFNPTGTYITLTFARHLAMAGKGIPLCFLNGTIVLISMGDRKSREAHVLTVSYSSDSTRLVEVPIDVTFPLCMEQLGPWLGEIHKLPSAEGNPSGAFIFPFLTFVKFVTGVKIQAPNKVVAWCRLMLFVISIMNYAISHDKVEYFAEYYVRQRFEQDVVVLNRITTTATELSAALILAGLRCFHCQRSGGFTTSVHGVQTHYCPYNCKGHVNPLQPPVTKPSALAKEAARYYLEITAFLGSSHSGAITSADHERFRKQSGGKWPVGGPMYSRNDINAAKTKTSTPVLETYTQAVARLAQDQSSIVMEGY